MIEISITIDDPHIERSALLSPEARDEKIRAALKKSDSLQAALFVCGHRLDSTEGRNLLSAWGSENHLLGNHTFSHPNLNLEEVEVSEFILDIERCHEMIFEEQGFTSLFRYPFLKAGNTLEKRDAIRDFLKARGYRQGYVSIDASDWCIDARLQRALQRNEKTELLPYRNFYLTHMRDRISYYDRLSIEVLGHSVKHTLLIHHNLLNALFLEDLLNDLVESGCRLINAEEAYQDPVYRMEPDIVPLGESILWALAKENGGFEAKLRYPAEDEVYERAAMDNEGL